MKTKCEVIDARSNGLKLLDVAIKHQDGGLPAIIEATIKSFNEIVPQMHYQRCWTMFANFFGNTWRPLYRQAKHYEANHDVSASFNLDEALTVAQLADIKQRCGIDCDHEATHFGWDRKDSERHTHCRMHNCY